MSGQIIGTKRVGVKKRVGAAITATVMAAGLTIGAVTPAQAAPTVVYYVASSWAEANASATSTGGAGYLQGFAYLGDTRKWGKRSLYDTKAHVIGFNFTHNAILYRNGAVFKKAQS